MESDGSDDLYRTLFVNGTTISLLIDPETGVIIDANTRACAYYEYSYEEITSKTIHDINTLTQEGVRREMDAAARELRNHFVFPHKKKSGEVRHVEVYSSPVTIDGRTRLHSIIFDIEEKVRIEKALEQERRQMLSILENIPISIYVADVDTYEVLYANSAMQRLYGTTIVGNACFRAIHGRDAPCPFCTNPMLIADGEPYHWEYRSPVLERDFSVVDRLIDWPDGRTVRFEAAVDITERKRTEEELRRLNATKDKLFSIIAHDLKNPFLNIVSLLQVLEGDIGYLSIDQLADALGVLRSSTQSAYALTENLLDWSRHQLGYIEFKPTPIRLNELVSTVFDLFEKPSARKSIALKNDIADETFAYGDPDMVATILRNLISNAIKFTEDGGTITTRLTTRSAMHRIEVHDTGIGMTHDTAASLFDPSSHVRTRGTRNERGSGLGLLICSEFIERHGGSIDVKSSLGSGSVFGFTLPIYST